MSARHRQIIAGAWLSAAHIAGLAAPAPRDGSHDLDFAMGRWKTHSSRLLHPLSGSHDWVEMDGSTVVTPVWGGHGNLAEYRAEGPGSHVELLALRLYDPQSGQWNLNFATSARGIVSTPAYGEFKEGRIVFLDQEPFSGRMILVRFALWPVDRDTVRSEQAFSSNGGRTWEMNWTTTYVRVPDAEAPR